MKKIAFITCEALPKLTKNDQVLQNSLTQKGFFIEALVWSDENINWSSYDFLLLRSVWDYHQKSTAFKAWLQKLALQKVKVINPLEIVLENMHKFYLKKIALEGFDIIPTEFIEKGSKIIWEDFLKYQDNIIVKPAISASAFGTYLINRKNIAQKKEKLNHLLRQDGILLQPFIAEIQTKGEWSLIFMQGQYSHSVLKFPKEQDFRVQTKFGGRVVYAKPSFAIIEQAQAIVNTFAKDLAYVRVDGIDKNGTFYLMELELIEPELFLYEKFLIERFADILAGYMK